MQLKTESSHILDFKNRNFKAPVLAKTILSKNLEKELLVFALDKDQLISNRAIWVLNHCADIEPDRIKLFHSKLISHLKNKNLHNGVIRSVLRIIRNHPVPKKQESFMLDKCLEYIKNPSEAIAVRAFAMPVAFNIAKPYPELLNELEIILRNFNIAEESAGIKVTIRNTLNKIAKLKVKQL